MSAVVRGGLRVVSEPSSYQANRKTVHDTAIKNVSEMIKFRLWQQSAGHSGTVVVFCVVQKG